MTDIIEHVLDLIPDDQIANTKSENSFLTNVINEIVEGSNGIVLKKIIIYNLKDDKFNNENLRTLLKGGKYDTLHFEPARLFGIYFRYSNLFADKTLQDIAAAVNCDKDKLKEIELIANKREISKNSKLFAEINKCY